MGNSRPRIVYRRLYDPAQQLVTQIVVRFHFNESLDDRENRLGRVNEHAVLDALQQPIGLITGKIGIEAQAARARLTV